MIQTIFAWILLAAVIASAYPWSAWLLARAAHPDRLLSLLLTLALSIGTLTLLMFWESLLGIPFNLLAITLPYFALALVGFWLWTRQKTALPDSTNSDSLNPSVRRLMLPLLLLVCAAVLFNGAYWPFYRDDTLGIYHRYGLLMYETGTLVPFAGRDDAFYQAYPMQMPLVYTYSYLASGWVNEYLAKTGATLLSLACLPAAYVLGRRLFGSLAGWLAALLLATMPAFGRWASSGYVDLPMAFCYTLAAIFCWRLWDKDNGVDALLAGISIGLALWTKNAAFVGLGCIGLWLLYGWINRRIRFLHILTVLVACAVVAAPWYVRNLLEAGLVIPPTAWTDQAERTLSTLLVFITQPENFSLSGWLITAAIILTIVNVVRLRRATPADMLLLILTIPFFGFWWLLASYDPRFVLLFLPLLAVLAGGWLNSLCDQLPEKGRSRLLLPLAGIALLLSLYVAWISVEYKSALVRDPLMDDTAKHQVVLQGRE